MCRASGVGKQAFGVSIGTDIVGQAPSGKVRECLVQLQQRTEAKGQGGKVQMGFNDVLGVRVTGILSVWVIRSFYREECLFESMSLRDEAHGLTYDIPGCDGGIAPEVARLPEKDYGLAEQSDDS